MKKNRLAVWILLMAFLASFPGIAGAAESVMTVMPQGAVNVTEENGQVVQMTTNFPLKNGSVMEASGGQCTVQGGDCGFIAQNNAVFSLDNADGKWVCTIYSGKVNYVLHSGSMVKFVHANAEYDCRKITPVKAGGRVEGSAAVDGDILVFANTAGESVFVPTFAGVIAAPLVVGSSAAGGISTTTVAVGAGVAAAGAGAGLGLGLSSGHSSKSPQ